MKRTKKYLSVAALAIALFASVQVSASDAPKPKNIKRDAQHQEVMDFLVYIANEVARIRNLLLSQ